MLIFAQHHDANSLLNKHLSLNLRHLSQVNAVKGHSIRYNRPKTIFTTHITKTPKRQYQGFYFEMGMYSKALIFYSN